MNEDRHSGDQRREVDRTSDQHFTEEKRRALDTNVELILSFTNEKLTDLKEHMTKEVDRIEKKIDSKCLSCIYISGLQDKAERNWWHIQKLWAWSISAFMATFTTMGMFFYLFWKHVTLK
jgi:hypothetical protein